MCLAKETPLEITQDMRDFVLMASEHLSLFLENLYIKCRMRDLSVALSEAQSREEANRDETGTEPL